MTTTRDWMTQAQQRHADAVKAATRNAPAWVRRGIDRDRVCQGLAPVWQVEHRTAETDASGWVVLVGPCCPGRSMPVTAATDGLHIPEIVDPHAFDHSVRAIQAGRHHVDLEEGHGGPVIATTRDGTLTFTSSEGTGLMAIAMVKVGLHRSVMLAAGVAGIEVDLFLTVDRVPVLAHDPYLNPTTCRTADDQEITDTVWLMEHTLDELDALWRCGTAPDPDLPDAAVVPDTLMTFDELIEALADHP